MSDGEAATPSPMALSMASWLAQQQGWPQAAWAGTQSGHVAGQMTLGSLQTPPPLAKA